MCRTTAETDAAGSIVLCDDGRRRYAEAVARGSLAAEHAPECLVELRLLEPDHNGDLVPVAPGTAATLFLGPLRRMAQDQLDAIASAETMYAEAGRVYDDARPAAGDDIRLIRGAENISAVLQAAVDDCQLELLTIQPGGGRPYELLMLALEKEIPALRRGVAQHTVYQHSIRSHGPTLEYVREATAAGAEIRTTDEVIDRLIVCDRQVAFIPTAVPRGQEALEIRHPAIVRFMARLFEIIWARAVPWDGAAPPLVKPAAVASELQQTIIRMLISGHTQAKIARELGMSLRTLTTHVSKISSELGSASPIQLGYLIAENGLLDQDLPEQGSREQDLPEVQA